MTPHKCKILDPDNCYRCALNVDENTDDDEYDHYLEQYLSEVCDYCQSTATHNQDGRKVCNAHLDNAHNAPRAFARND